jgi:outer membrane immunogenic protein
MVTFLPPIVSERPIKFAGSDAQQWRFLMRFLKSAFVASVACAVAAPAMAADLPARPVYKAPEPVAAAVYSWTGFYVGGNLGGKWGRFDQRISTGTGAVLGFVGDSDASFLGGGQVGYMWQAGALVFGVEGDIDATRLRNTFTAVAPVPAPFAAGDTLAVKNDWQASARGRLGFAWDRVLIYGTGGGAWGNLKAAGTFPAVGLIPGTIVTRDRTVFGWTVGGGLDYGIAPGWSLGAEYRFTRFENNNNGTAFGLLTTTAAGGTTPLTLASRLDTHEVTARLNYHFNMGGPY